MTHTEVLFPEDKPGKIKKWKVTAGSMVAAGRILLLYEIAENSENLEKMVEKKLKAIKFGKIIKLLKNNGEIIQPRELVYIIEDCKHPTVMKDLCAECGADLRQESLNAEKILTSQASVPMLHSIPELKVCPELAEKIGKEDEERLLRDKKLVLLVDLDQTIVHTTNDNVPNNMEDVHHFQLYGPNSPWYHTRLRPHTRRFLSEISKYYELHICTFGARNYAHKVASILDKDGTLFSHRILSRDECFDPLSKTANLKALFPCGVDLVCIIDDREDVWQGCGNLVQVKPYHFFLHTGDINVPPGLGKHDDPAPSISLTNIFYQQSSENGTENKECNNEYNNENLKENKEIDINLKKSEQSESDNTEIKTSDPLNTKIENNELDEQNTTQIINKQKGCVNEDINEANKTNIEQEGNFSGEQLFNQDYEDQDDYLLYLEDILKRIHAEYYCNIEQEHAGRRSLKDIIPKVRSRVLKDVHITFSGLIPNNQKLQDTRAYKVARAFGATVTQEITKETTHLVALQPGTQKVHQAKKEGKIKIVNPDWLWSCAERWEHVEERLYPVNSKNRVSRIPPPHCSSPGHVEEELPEKPEGNFAYTINPFMAFSKEDIDDMDREIDEDMSDQDQEEDIEGKEYLEGIEDGDYLLENHRNLGKRELENDSDSNPFTENDDYEPMCKKKKDSHKRNGDSSSSDSSSSNSDKNGSDEDDPITRFRRGEPLPDDLSLGDDSQGSVGDLEPDEVTDEREWDAMGEALEREFLSD